MHRRLAAIFLALAIAAGGSLAGAAPAAAAGLEHGCGPQDDGDVFCWVRIPEGRSLLSIKWFVDGNEHSNSGSSSSMEFSCTPGQRSTVIYYAYLSPPAPPNGELFAGSMTPMCPGAPIANVFAGCSSGGSRMQCSVSYTGGTDPVSIRWTVDGDVRTFFNDKWRLDISCRAPSEMYISVTVSDASGGQTAAGYCFCHSGPLD